jgi:hypothetical protein
MRSRRKPLWTSPHLPIRRQGRSWSVAGGKSSPWLSSARSRLVADASGAPVLRDGGPQRVDQLAARLTAAGRRPIRPATVAAALAELHTAGLAAVHDHNQDGLTGRWAALPVARDPLLDAVDLHGAHDFRHTYATWRTPASPPG